MCPMEPAASPAGSGPGSGAGRLRGQREPFLQIRSPGQAWSSQAAPCLGFHSIFLGFGLQGYTPTSNPSSHSCFQRKKNTVKRGCNDFWAVFKTERQRWELLSLQALIQPGPSSPSAPSVRAGKHLPTRQVRGMGSNSKFLRTKMGVWSS